MSLKSTKVDKDKIEQAKNAINQLLNEPTILPTRTDAIQINQRNSDGEWELKTYSTSKVILNQTDKDGLHWVYVLVDATYFEYKKKKRWRKKFNTATKVSQPEWDKHKQEIKPKSPNAFERNTTINKLYATVNEAITDLSKGNYVELSDELSELKKVFGHGIKLSKGKHKSLTDYIEEYINHRKAQGTQRGTFKEFITIKKRLLLYEQENEPIYFKDINLKVSDKLKSFWTDKYHPNTIKKSFEILTTVLNYFYARKDEMHLELSDKYKLKEFGVTNEYQQTPIALSEEEIDLIIKFDFKKYKKEQLIELEKQIKKEKLEFKREFMIDGLNQRIETLELTRDRALLQIGTGLRVSDLFNIHPANVKLNKNQIHIRPIKTRNTKTQNLTVLPLFEIAKTVLTKYDMNTSKKPFRVASQNYNKSIKDLLDVVGITDEIEVVEFKDGKLTHVVKRKCDEMTSHNFRDTFITSAVRKGVPIPVILKWTNQSGYDVMKKYINLVEQDLEYENDIFKAS